VTRLTLIDAWVGMDNGESNIVWSLGWDLGHHEEFWNGSKNKIHKMEANIWVPKSFGIFWYRIE
jgi:hypothetical protein